MRHLAQGDWPKLTHLHLEDNFIDAAGVSMLTKSNWVSLQHMSLDTTAVRVYPGWVICKLGSPSRISRLWFGRMCFEGQFSTGVTRHQTVWFTRANSVLGRTGWLALKNFDKSLSVYSLWICWELYMVYMIVHGVRLYVWWLMKGSARCLKAIVGAFDQA